MPVLQTQRPATLYGHCTRAAGLAAPILQDPAVPALGVVTAIALASSVVDTSPFSTNGALLLANVQNVDGRVFFKWLLYWGILITALVPVVAWSLFVVMGGLIT